jgi:hypothetical protein
MNLIDPNIHATAIYMEFEELVGYMVPYEDSSLFEKYKSVFVILIFARFLKLNSKTKLTLLYIFKD